MSIPGGIFCNVIKNISIGVELELQGIAIQRCRIGNGILLIRDRSNIVTSLLFGKPIKPESKIKLKTNKSQLLRPFLSMTSSVLT